MNLEEEQDSGDDLSSGWCEPQLPVMHQSVAASTTNFEELYFAAAKRTGPDHEGGAPSSSSSSSGRPRFKAPPPKAQTKVAPPQRTGKNLEDFSKDKLRS